MEFDWSVDHEDGASLVGVRVRNDEAVPRRVRIESRIDGPLLPPRRGGVPESGWDATGVTAVLDPGERAAFGFAALADPSDPPVEIASVEPASVDENGGHGTADGETDPARAAVRDLGSHRPPRAAVDGRGGPDRAASESGDAAASGSGGDGADRAGDGTDGETTTITRSMVRITDDVGPIYGVEGREYDLTANDVVTLPEPNVGPLLEQGAAERLD